MKTTIWEWINSIENNWFFSIWLIWMKIVYVELSFSIDEFHCFIWLILFKIEEFNQIIKELNLNHQFWLKSSFLPVEKIIIFQMNHQSQWNDNWFIIEFFLSFSILNESFELKVHIKLNRKILIQRLQEIYLNLFQQLTFRIDESSIQMLDEIQWMI